MSYLNMQGVSYTYPGWPAVVQQVDWDIAPGEFHGLVGRSGCGKTTLLKLAAGLLKPDTGRVMLEGSPVIQPGPKTGFVFQSPTLLEWLRVLDNVLLPISIQRKPAESEVARARQLLALMGLNDYQQHFPRQLSGGQQSRVAIARALIQEPAILLMDEPFAALDAITREDLQNDLLALCRARQTTVFFVTHDISEAVYLADRVAVMAQGRIRSDVRIDLPHARDTSTRYSPRFNDICAQLRQAMDGVAA